MRYKNLEILKAYRITKGSSDGTFIPGDIIWLSENGDINSVQAAGSIDSNEVDKVALDFEVEDATDYEVIKTNRSEICRGVIEGIQNEANTNS